MFRVLVQVAFCSAAFLLFGITVNAQRVSLGGQLVDKASHAPLNAAGVTLTSKTDSTNRRGSITDSKGNFQFKNLSPGNYILKTSYLAHQSLKTEVILGNTDKDLGMLEMDSLTTVLDAVTIQGQEIRATQKGDTTEYNAKAFKTNPDATAQDLVAKIPGVTVENGSVKAQGEDVQKVTVDGKDFFGDDATLALKNLPAEVIDKIQVFNKLSDQSQFTGFNDGNTQKTINIVTIPGKSNGQFGKLFAGYGTDDRYQVGGNLNLFKGARRISLIGLSNNINQQNFSAQDLLGITGSNNQRPAGPPGGFSGFGGGRSSGGSRGGSPGGYNNSSNNFLIGQQGGINTTTSLGLNYSDSWGKKINVTASYFFNQQKNSTNSQNHTEYFLNGESNQLYNEDDTSSTNNFNHRFNVRFEYNIDTSNSIIITPKVTLQENHLASSFVGVNSLENNELLSQTQSNSDTHTSGYDFNNNILYRHKFLKAGRTFSWNIGTDVNAKNGNAKQFSLNEFFNPDSTSIIDQRSTTKVNGYSLSTNLTYTEPAGKNAIVQFTYVPSYNKNKSNQETLMPDDSSNDYTVLDSALSNNFINSVTTQRGGISYRYHNPKINLMAGLNYQNTKLISDQTFPRDYTLTHGYDDFLPIASFNYIFSKRSNIWLMYRTSTNVPSISQLQNVINNSNPLQLTTGNPLLKQEYVNTFITRYSLVSIDKTQTFFAFLSAGYTASHISSASFIATQDSVLDGGVVLHKGSKLTVPVNLDGYYNVNSFLTYSIPVKFLKSNLNMNAGFIYTRTPGLLNNEHSITNSSTPSLGFVLGSNISPKIDFTISYSGNYTIANNSQEPELNSNYFNQSAGVRFNWLPWKGLVLNTDLTNTLYTGLGEGYNQNIFLWNAAVGYKFLKNDAGEFRLSAYDILNQNKSVSRTITDTYVQDTQTEVLKQYFMLTFTYTIRNFKVDAKK